MSRLYYDPPVKTINPQEPKTAAGEKKGEEGNYLEKVAKLIPSEVLAAFMLFMGLAKNLEGGTQSVAYWFIFGFCLLLTPIYLNKQSEDNKPKRFHLIISTLAFAAWAYVISGMELQGTIAPETYKPALASILVGIFSLGIGAIPLKE